MSSHSSQSSSTSTHSESHHSSSSGNRSPRKSSKGTSTTTRTIENIDQNVVTTIKGKVEPVVVSGKAEVFVEKKESWDYEALQRLEEKIAIERAAIIDAEKLLKDQTTLYSEALQTKEKRLADAIQLDKVVGDRASERDRLLSEEKELEVRRAAAHAKAVELETARTDLLAQAVLAKEEAKVSENLALHRSEGIKQATATADAHRLAIQKLEESRSELRRKDIDVRVKEEALPQPRAVDINVAVQPLHLPEARIESKTMVQGAGASSSIRENIPTHSKTVIPANEVQVSGHFEETKVERHIISEKDRVVM